MVLLMEFLNFMVCVDVMETSDGIRWFSYWYSGEIEWVRDAHLSLDYLVWSIATYGEFEVSGGKLESYLVPVQVPRVVFFDYCYCSRCFIDTSSVIVFNRIGHGEDIFLRRRRSTSSLEFWFVFSCSCWRPLWVNMWLACNWARVVWFGSLWVSLGLLMNS